MSQELTNLIDGVWQDTTEHVDVLNPVDGSVVGRIGYGGLEHAQAAADAAAAALPAWGGTPARVRADLLHRAAELISARAEEIGLLLAREAGKRLPEAVGEVRFSAEYFRWFAEEVRRPHGAVHPQEAQERRHLTFRRPAGVVASLTPWNFPCSIPARKLAPALAAGCTVVARVSEQAPLAATELVRCLTDAGMPPGTVNLVHGAPAEITGAFLDHPAVRVVSFTGSTPVGRKIMSQASSRVVRPLLELGGNAAFIVFDDADLDAAVTGAMLAKFRNTGQSCIGANRFFVHASVHDDFVARFSAAVDAMSIGDGLASPVPDLAACIDHRRVRAVNGLVEEALDAGAKKVTRDFSLPEGAFCAPSILVDVPDRVGLATEEVFGPAAGIFRFEDEEEVLQRANATEMGLAGYFYTRDQARIWRVGEQLDVGITGINNALPTVAFAPMGGTKQSGLGREGGSLGLEEFEETRYLSIGI
ncbi:succinate-semialdehyde dehdyrogenase [Sinomonas atrocyanea]|uniref:Succinate-semialdehyde dehdyrogenase n=1 Tax=Sinomonas atrocyanea TaxID=37927 RepID=A0A127A080_9MICC|nr:NAD-dependent succinate-semialdehyde dehydrogenase [Sinomonas atrocyanea]AMM32858.1 succinate-semialdehyde dehdyrogenase [Sinomonas atrocyanea]GEB66145.1 NAD-dependent succinate-semialdehyde dehydrogenase [Sinomonas atrocyanea]GGG61721.1 NAD-dependent succinate-semialdehyde dehydrogenase [Sinomonas atrocyanea]